MLRTATRPSSSGTASGAEQRAVRPMNQTRDRRVGVRRHPAPEERNTMQYAKVERTIAGRTLSFETGGMARQSAGAVVARIGDTVVLSAVTVANPREGIDFFPLTVEYREKVYAAGKFPGGFIKREGRPDEQGDPHLPPDRPPDPAALPRGIQQRDPDLRDRALRGQGERARRPHDERLVRGDAPRPDAVQGTDRGGPRRARRRRVRRRSRAPSSSTRPTWTSSSRARATRS